MASGTDLYQLALAHKGERYVNQRVPKDNPDWRGPWDCAELASWAVYQVAGVLYGCIDNKAKPAVAEAYSGSWVRDARDGPLLPATQDDASRMAGVILIRKPAKPGSMGHIAITSGHGETIEAAGINLGVRPGKVSGRLWHFFAKIPELQYELTDYKPTSKALPFLLELREPPMTGDIVKSVQQALVAQKLSPGPVDGEYGPQTVAAVEAFQNLNKLIADGVAGPASAKKLGVEWPT